MTDGHELWLGTPTERRLVQALDEDDWWTRPIKPHDLQAVRVVDPDATPAFTYTGGTYCRTAIQALAIDQIRSAIS